MSSLTAADETEADGRNLKNPEVCVLIRVTTVWKALLNILIYQYDLKIYAKILHVITADPISFFHTF